MLIFDGLRSCRWPKTKGKIIKREDRSFSGPGFGGGNAGTEIVSVRYPEPGYYYEYQAGLIRHTGDTYFFGVHLDREHPDNIIGDHLSVFYDPKRSVLQPGIQLGTLFGPIVIAGGIGYGMWLLFS